MEIDRRLKISIIINSFRKYVCRMLLIDSRGWNKYKSWCKYKNIDRGLFIASLLVVSNRNSFRRQRGTPVWSADRTVSFYLHCIGLSLSSPRPINIYNLINKFDIFVYKLLCLLSVSLNSSTIVLISWLIYTCKREYESCANFLSNIRN